MLLGVSLDRVPQSGWMLWQLAALVLRPSKSHSGSALLYVTELLPGCCAAFAQEGWERRAWPRRDRGPAAGNTALHWHRTRDTRKPSTTGTRERLRGGRAGRQQRKPSVCQQFTWTGFLGLWHFVSQCNFTRVSVCVCVFHFSINKKQQQERSL